MVSKSNPTFGTITGYKLGSVSFFCGTDTNPPQGQWGA